MELNLHKDFNNYFNITLRNHLKYPEQFNISIKDNRIILVPNGQSKLLELLKTNPATKKQILNQILQGLPKSITNVYFSTHGYDIVINFEQIPHLDTGIYANIISNVDETDVNNFCISFKDVCAQPAFWFEMTRQRFPEYYIDIKGINWEIIYKGLLWYTKEREFAKKMKLRHGSILELDEDYSRIVDFLRIFVQKHPETFKYIIINRIKKLYDKQALKILDIISTYPSFNYEVINHILNTYNITREILIRGLDIYINNIPIAKLFLEYRGTDSTGNIVKITRNDITNLLNFEANNTSTKLKPEDFDFYTQIIQQME